MKKNDKLFIPCTSEDKQKLKERAKKCRLSLTGYCLFILMNTKPRMLEEN